MNNMYKSKYGFVYIWYDRKNKRFYIGSHWGTVDDGYICSSTIMRKAYNRRKDDFKRRILCLVFTNRKDLLEQEERWLAMVDPSKTMPWNSTPETRKNVRYYNLYLGTYNHWWSYEQSRITIGEKISIAKTGKKIGPCPPDRRRAISEAKKRKFKETQELLGYKLSPEHIEKVASQNRGRKHTDEWKKQSGERLREQWANGTRKGKKKI